MSYIRHKYTYTDEIQEYLEQISFNYLKIFKLDFNLKKTESHFLIFESLSSEALTKPETLVLLMDLNFSLASKTIPQDDIAYILDLIVGSQS